MPRKPKPRNAQHRPRVRKRQVFPKGKYVRAIMESDLSVVEDIIRQGFIYSCNAFLNKSGKGAKSFPEQVVRIFREKIKPNLKPGMVFTVRELVKIQLMEQMAAEFLDYIDYPVEERRVKKLAINGLIIRKLVDDSEMQRILDRVVNAAMHILRSRRLVK